ncbi:MAG: hypothetical protein BGP12_00810 [Rhodospirillales bacterium 70-18]|nr:DUF2336 domain-containing protein [Rhodospirillales bacterium]OJY78416.1 MAG: hypothetical protein BGP12_00810 [Rhodospirillales bacterium 70-18]
MMPSAAATRPLDDAKARVRQGAAATTPPDLLLALANDPEVTVRAAVAMNLAAPAQVDRMLARDADERVRTLLARKLAQLVPTLAHRDRDRLREQALDTLTALVEDEAVRVRGAITDVLKDMPVAPRRLILRLAQDSVLAVCEPVIRLSPLLSGEDLLALIAQAPSPATATAVARRAELPEAVSDAVAATADTAAITALLENTSAAIRETTLDMLIGRAADHEAWHAPLVRRPVLSARASRALSDIVATQLLDELASRADLDASVTAELRQRLSIRLKPAATAGEPAPDLSQAMSEAQNLFADDRLNEDALLAAVHRGEARMVSAMLAVAADVGASVVDRAATLRSAKGLVSLVWKAGFSMRVAGPVQVLLARLAPATVLRATAGGGFPLAVEEMRWQIDFLCRMGR